MSFNVLEQFDDIFGDINSLDQLKVEKFLKDSLAFFGSLQETLQSADDAERQKALDLASALQNKLEDFAKQALAKTGLDPEVLSAFVKTAGISTSDVWTKPELKK